MDPVCLDLDSDLDPNFYCFLEHVPSPPFLRSRTLNIQIIGCPLTSLLLIHICAWFLIRIVRSKQHGAKSYTHGPGPGYAFLPNPQSPIPNPKTGSIPVLSWTANFGHLEVVCIPMNDLIFRYSQMLGRIYRYWSPVSFFFPVLRLLLAHDSKVFVLHGLLVLIDSFSFLQEMYTQVGPQFRDELQRHHLPTYLVII